jgi:polyisoprenoid-binding protein YceI/mono/diheme cytochrome c family protein
MSASDPTGLPDEGYADASPAKLPWYRRAAKASRSHWVLSSFAVAAVLVLAGAVYVWSQVHSVLSVANVAVSYTVPDAPHLVAGNGETVYRIDPTHSSLTYGVDENLIGQTAHHVTGSTNGIAGDLALNAAHPSASRVGNIVANVEQLHSDNNLRDQQLRQRYLESETYPLVTFSTTKLTGLPASVVDGKTYSFTMTGTLTVHGVTAPETWKVTAKVANGKLDATAATTVKMSSFGVGPINLAGLVSTGDKVGLTFQFEALDPSKYTVPTTIAAPADLVGSGKGPSFKEAVAPILEQNCASCHQPDTVGYAHYKLTTAGDAAKVADGLRVVTTAKYMPPWPASDLGVPLLHSKALSQKDIDTIAAWAAAGGKLDEPASTPITPATSKPGTMPRADVVMKMPQAYTGSLSNPNDYRCFVLDPHLTKPMYMTGYTVTPDQITEIHHAQIFHIDAAQAKAGEQMSGQDGKPGWSCYAGPSLPDGGGFKAFKSKHAQDQLKKGFVGGFTGQPGLVAGWVPGQDPVIYPENSGIKMEAGDALVLQIHYHYDTTPVPDRSTVSLQLTPGTEKVKELDIINPIAPVEIPCMPGVVAPLCDRNAAIADDNRLYGPGGGSIEGGLLLLCGKTSDQLAANFKDGVAHTTCDYQVPYDGTIVGVLGHMHTLGKSFRLTLEPGTPQQKILLDLPVWNFDWQMNYGLAQPIHVTGGEKIEMSCSWDRSLEPNRAPKYIVFAEGTEDEMCFGTYAMIPDS